MTTTQSLKDRRNAKRRCFEKRPFSTALRMYDNEKWGKTPEGKDAIKKALLSIEMIERRETTIGAYEKVFGPFTDKQKNNL